MNIPNASDLVEDSLRILDEAELSDAEFRAAASALYAFESNYESRGTFFRVMDTLERRGYFATVPAVDHPRYDAYEQSFDEVRPGAIAPLLRNPRREWSEEDNPVVGYVKDETLYAEHDSELWKELAEAGEIDAGETPERDLFWTAAEVCEAADEQGESDLIMRWYAALGFHFGMESGEDEEALLEELESNPDLERLRSVVAEIEDLEMKLLHPERDLAVPPPPLREAHPVLKWWFDLV